jgi:hypothetical protein
LHPNEVVVDVVDDVEVEVELELVVDVVMVVVIVVVVINSKESGHTPVVESFSTHAPLVGCLHGPLVSPAQSLKSGNEVVDVLVVTVDGGAGVPSAGIEPFTHALNPFGHVSRSSESNALHTFNSSYTQGPVVPNLHKCAWHPDRVVVEVDVLVDVLVDVDVVVLVDVDVVVLVEVVVLVDVLVDVVEV